ALRLHLLPVKPGSTYASAPLPRFGNGSSSRPATQQKGAPSARPCLPLRTVIVPPLHQVGAREPEPETRPNLAGRFERLDTLPRILHPAFAPVGQAPTAIVVRDLQNQALRRVI